MGKILILMGIILICLGLGLEFGDKMALGRLPGDILIKGKNIFFSFPITTCLLLSAFLSLVLYLIQYLFSK